MSPVKYATMKFEIAIENGRSFKLRQTRSQRVSLVYYKHITDHGRTLHSLPVGCKEG